METTSRSKHRMRVTNPQIVTNVFPTEEPVDPDPDPVDPEPEPEPTPEAPEQKPDPQPEPELATPIKSEPVYTGC